MGCWLCRIRTRSEIENHGGTMCWRELLMAAGRQRQGEEGVGLHHVIPENVPIHLTFPTRPASSDSSKIGGQTSDLQ